jgi:hypothetical protein
MPLAENSTVRKLTTAENTPASGLLSAWRTTMSMARAPSPPTSDCSSAASACLVPSPRKAATVRNSRTVGARPRAV